MGSGKPKTTILYNGKYITPNKSKYCKDDCSADTLGACIFWFNDGGNGNPECKKSNTISSLKQNDLLSLRTSNQLFYSHDPVVNSGAHLTSYNSKIDYDKLANAIAFAETDHCNDGTARKRNNCVGIRSHGQAVYFASQAQSIEAAKQLWMKSYKLYPTTVVTYQGKKESLAQIWTGNDHPQRWLLAFNQYYHSH
jgi:hypothetical protein